MKIGKRVDRENEVKDLPAKRDGVLELVGYVPKPR